KPEPKRCKRLHLLRDEAFCFIPPAFLIKVTAAKIVCAALKYELELLAWSLIYPPNILLRESYYFKYNKSGIWIYRQKEGVK
ncbi:MAG TPA: hypothetical protein PJ990_16400, partial [Saprospiraceae bacterium]|nr:hypothetical protein [Saprospiraceae bacterium]